MEKIKKKNEKRNRRKARKMVQKTASAWLLILNNFASEISMKMSLIQEVNSVRDKVNTSELIELTQFIGTTRNEIEYLQLAMKEIFEFVDKFETRDIVYALRMDLIRLTLKQLGYNQKIIEKNASRIYNDSFGENADLDIDMSKAADIGRKEEDMEFFKASEFNDDNDLTDTNNTDLNLTENFTNDMLREAYEEEMEANYDQYYDLGEEDRRKHLNK